MILPIHNLGFLEQSDMIVALKDGAVVEKGTYHELMVANNEFAVMMQVMMSARRCLGAALGLAHA